MFLQNMSPIGPDRINISHPKCSFPIVIDHFNCVVGHSVMVTDVYYCLGELDTFRFKLLHSFINIFVSSNKSVFE